MKEKKLELVVKEERFNDIRFLNRALKQINASLQIGGVFEGNAETYDEWRKVTLEKYPFPFNRIYIIIYTIIFRIIPKLKTTKNIYFNVSQGRVRVMSKAEIYGRLYYGGFEFIDEKIIDNNLHFSFKKVREPFDDTNPSYHFLIKLKRIGFHGKIINVYKFRTMSPYSEYLQEYLYLKNNLKEGGKINNDFRITRGGKLLRKYWIDELPMLFNLLKGEMKLVGVRPLSEHYFALYSKDLQSLRVTVKPGLIPPFYVDMPVTLEEIMASEIKYLLAYKERPIYTDIVYFVTSIKNIILKRKRSS